MYKAEFFIFLCKHICIGKVTANSAGIFIYYIEFWSQAGYFIFRRVTPYPGILSKNRSIIPNIEVHIIQDAGHIPHYERTEKVNSMLIDFFNNIVFQAY